MVAAPHCMGRQAAVCLTGVAHAVQGVDVRAHVGFVWGRRAAADRRRRSQQRPGPHGGAAEPDPAGARVRVQAAELRHARASRRPCGRLTRRVPLMPALSRPG